MKTKSIFTIILVIAFMMNVNAQETNVKDYIWKFNGKKKEHTIGMFGGITGSYTRINGKTAGWLGARLGVVFNKRFNVGLAGSGLWYDYKLSDLVTDGTYHLESGYAGAYFEYLQPVGNRVKLGVSLLMGGGTAKYTYDKKYRDEKYWYQRTIDTQDFSVIEPGAEAMVRIAPKWWIGVNGSYRATSPIRLKGTSSTIFNKFSAGVSVTFGVF